MPQAERAAAPEAPAPSRVAHPRRRDATDVRDHRHHKHSTTGTGPAHTDADSIRTDLGGHTDTNVHATRASRTAHTDSDDNTHVTRGHRTARTGTVTRARTGTVTRARTSAGVPSRSHSRTTRHTHRPTSPTRHGTPRKGPA
ncbi:hypothetical protein [Streptomyces sp. WM6386]|uniref:hypothetical protein n=1 Tax=Streptomyces sp. WM6386 TaxID=1415558 RepID=UPI0006195836|nr:hypothetical protein [Streptomyces sp. WM6386]KKD04689.1 hypothetical protein TN53_28545 [Streptomyces sp. WM6386]